MTALPATKTAASPRLRRLRQIANVAVIAALGCAGYVWFWHCQLKRLQAVAPGVLYRSGQPTEFGLRHLIERRGVRTVVSLQLFDFRLHGGWIDLNEPDGAKESEFVRSLGARSVQWPMGDEACWPWPDPWEFEEFFRLIDDPANRPVLIHCMGGRHRTGTFSALYRLEYDRWTPQAALDEMYSFNFGMPVPIQELNLRSYRPRPLPDDADWPTVAAAFGVDAAERPADAMPVLARRIRTDATDGRWRRAFGTFVGTGHPYALPLASRVVDDVDDPLLTTLLPQARTVLANPKSLAAETTAAAALIADFGSPDDQAALVEMLRREGQTTSPTEFYEALVCGITNRYTSNRLPYLRPLLDDLRPRIDRQADKYSYAATAVGRVAAITGEMAVMPWLEPDYDLAGRTTAIDWLDNHSEATKPARLTPPQGRRVVLVGDGPQEEDLSKMRR